MGRVYEALRRAAEQDSKRNGDHDDAAIAPTTMPTADAEIDFAPADALPISPAPRPPAPPREETFTPITAATIKANNGIGSKANGNGGNGDGFGNGAPSSSESARLSSSFEEAVHGSSIFQSSSSVSVPPAGTYGSAFNEQTEKIVGTALSGDYDSRAAGATLDAVSSTRAKSFPVLEIDSARVEPHLITITQARSAYTELFRSLRTRVLHAGEQDNRQVFVISSAGMMEGKTMTSLNLSWLLAQTDGVRALLIDGDLRHPCAADYLGIDAPVGLSEILSGETTLEESIIRLEPSGLHLLPGGAARDDVADLLSGPKFAQVLADARRMFDYIIIDAPPLGIFTDAAVLMNRADGALLVVRSGRVRYAKLDRLLEQLPQDHILGIVLNGSDEQVDESNYYYNRRYLGGSGSDGSSGDRREEEAVEEVSV